MGGEVQSLVSEHIECHAFHALLTGPRTEEMLLELTDMELRQSVDCGIKPTGGVMRLRHELLTVSSELSGLHGRG